MNHLINFEILDTSVADETLRVTRVIVEKTSMTVMWHGLEKASSYAVRNEVFLLI